MWDMDDVMDDVKGVDLLRYLLTAEGDGKGSRKLSIIRTHTEDPGAVEVMWDNDGGDARRRW